MKWALLQLFLTVLIVPCISGELCVDTSATLIPAHGDKRITNSALWTGTLSMPMCLERCYQDPLCLSVNVSPEADTCVGFRQKFEGQTPNTEAVQGYRVYEMAKAQSFDCSTIDHCSSTFSGPSHCHENLCRCDIGYSLDGFHCRNLTECSSFSSVISEYPGYVKMGNTFKAISDVTLASCGNHCVKYVECQTGDYHMSTRQCWLDDNNWNEIDDSFTLSDPEFTYLQRECIW